MIVYEKKYFIKCELYIIRLMKVYKFAITFIIIFYLWIIINEIIYIFYFILNHIYSIIYTSINGFWIIQNRHDRI